MLVSDETIYRLSVYRLIVSVYRYRTDFELIPNPKSVFNNNKKHNIFLIVFLFKYRFAIRYRPEIGRYRLHTDLSFDCNVIFAGAGNELYRIRFNTDTNLIPIPILISHRFHTDFNTETDTDTSVFRPKNTDTDTEFKIPYIIINMLYAIHLKATYHTYADIQYTAYIAYICLHTIYSLHSIHMRTCNIQPPIAVLVLQCAGLDIMRIADFDVRMEAKPNPNLIQPYLTLN